MKVTQCYTVIYKILLVANVTFSAALTIWETSCCVFISETTSKIHSVKCEV
jgi:hypothetical protein